MLRLSHATGRLALTCAAAVVLATQGASAEDFRRVAGRLSLGLAAPPLAGRLQSDPIGFGAAGSLAAEYRPLAPIAFELELAASYFPVSVPEASNLPGFADHLSAQLGAKLYPVGGLYLAARGGVHSVLRELRGGGALEVGWDLAPTSAFSAGPFARAVFVSGSDPDRPVESYMVFGLTLALGSPAGPSRAQPAAAVEPEGPPPPAAAMEDGDSDGVPDLRDRCPGSVFGESVESDGCAPSFGPSRAPVAAEPERETSPAPTPHRRRRRHRRHR